MILLACFFILTIAIIATIVFAYMRWLFRFYAGWGWRSKHSPAYVALVSMAIMATACSVDPTPTAEPTADPTPTREHLSYQDCFTGEWVTGFAHINTNNNPCLEGEFQTVDLGTEDGRYVALYPEYWFWQVPAQQGTYAYMNAGGYFFRGGTRNGMQVELVQVDGQFGIQLEQVFERGVCYIIKQVGENSVPNGSLENISLAGQIHLTDGTIVQLRNQSFPARFSGSQGYEIFWVVETSHTQIDGVIAIYTEVVWANYLQGTHVTIHAIEILDAPPEFCEGDGVIEF